MPPTARKRVVSGHCLPRQCPGRLRWCDMYRASVTRGIMGLTPTVQFGEAVGYRGPVPKPRAVRPDAAPTTQARETGLASAMCH